MGAVVEVEVVVRTQQLRRKRLAQYRQKLRVRAVLYRIDLL
jgi:hypothetical protein